MHATAPRSPRPPRCRCSPADPPVGVLQAPHRSAPPIWALLAAVVFNVAAGGAAGHLPARPPQRPREGHHRLDPGQPRRPAPVADRDRPARRARHHQRIQHRHDPRHPGRRAAAPPDARRQDHRASPRPPSPPGSPRASPPTSPSRRSCPPATAMRTSLGDPGVLRAVTGAGLYLTLLGLFGLGLGAVIRSSAGAVATLFGVLFVPILLTALLPQSWQDTDRPLPADERRRNDLHRPAPGTHPRSPGPGSACSASTRRPPSPPGSS